jgi:hypothetical protein
VSSNGLIALVLHAKGNDFNGEDEQPFWDEEEGCCGEARNKFVVIQDEGSSFIRFDSLLGSRKFNGNNKREEDDDNIPLLLLLLLRIDCNVPVELVESFNDDDDVKMED